MKLFAQRILPIIKKTYFVGLAILVIAYLGASAIYTNPLWTAVALMCLAVAIVIMSQVKIDYELMSKKCVPYVIYAISFLVRLIYCILILPFIEQISDFGIVLDEAKSGYFLDCLDYYRFYFHKFLYPFLLHGLSLNNQTKIVIFQCFLVAWVPVILFLIGRKIGDERAGFGAAVMYGFWPSIVVYTQIVTEEHISALVTILIVYLLICMQQQIDKIEVWDKQFFGVLGKALVTGLLCGVASYSKDWALVILTATVICAVYQCLKSNFVQICVMLLACVMIFSGRSAFNTAIKNMGEGILGVSPNNGVISMQMFETLDPNSSGGYNVELNDEYMKIAEENNYDFELTNSIANNILKEKIKKDYNKMPRMLLHKAQNAYKSNEGMVGWALDKEIAEEYKDKFSMVCQIFKRGDQVIYLGIVILIMVSVVVNRDKYVFFLQLVMLGGAFVSLVVESQQRYKYSIISVWCIPAAVAGVWLLDKVKSRKNR